MRRLRFTVALCASTLSFAALAVALITWGGEEDNDADSAGALQGYFAEMSKIDDMSDQQFEESVFDVEQESAKSYAEAFDAVLAMLESEYGKVRAPSGVAEEHETLIEAIKDYRLGIDHGLRPLDFDAAPADFEALFSNVLADEDMRVSGAFCAIQEIATAQGIAADVGCQRA